MNAAPPDEPPPLSDVEVRRGMVVNVAAGCLGLVFIAAALGFPAPMLLESLGANGKQIGLLSAMQHILLMVQVPVAWWLGRLRRRKPFWFLAVITHRLLWCLPGLLPFCFPDPRDAIPWILGVVAVSTALDKASSPAWVSWMADLIPDRVSGRFWSLRQTVIFIPYLAATWFYRGCLEGRTDEALLHGFLVVFLVAAAFGSLDILVHLGVPEPAPHPAPDHHGLSERLRAPLASADFRRLTWAMGVWLAATGMVQTFAPVYCKQVLGCSYGDLAVLAFWQNLGVVAAGLLLARPLDRIGGRRCAIALLVLVPLLSAGWFYTGAPARLAVLGVTQFLVGGLASGLLLAQLKLIGSIAPRRDRVMAMAVHWTLLGAIASAGPLLGGVVKDLWPAGSAAGGYFHLLVLVQMALAWGLCIPLFRRIRRKGERAPEHSAPALEVDPGQVGGF